MESNIRVGYIRANRSAKPFEAVSVAQHQFTGLMPLDRAALATYLGAGNETLYIPEGTPVFPTANGLKILEPADITSAAPVLQSVGYLTQGSLYELTPFRREEQAFGYNGSFRDKSKFENIQYVRSHSFRAIYSWYMPPTTTALTETGGATVLTTLSPVSNPAVGQYLKLRTRANVMSATGVAAWSTGTSPVAGVSNSMPPAVVVDTAVATGDVVLGRIVDVRSLDQNYPKDTGIFYKDIGGAGAANPNLLANYGKLEILVDMYAVPFVVA